jgi:hypothetical protein
MEDNHIYRGSCNNCVLRKLCGEVSEYSIFESGCFHETTDGGRGKANFLHPNNPNFVSRLYEVGAFSDHSASSLRSTAHLRFPRYIPVLGGGVHLERAVNLPYVALNLHEVLQGTKEEPNMLRSLAASAIRERFNVAPETQLIAIGVAKDRPLERLWQRHQQDKIPELLAASDFSAITAPNFTFLQNRHRFHNLTNRLRMLTLIERFARQGIIVIPHINSTHKEDWHYWARYFSENLGLQHFCVEFQTGNRRPEHFKFTIDQMRDFKQRVGREFTPIIIGGLQAATELLGDYPNLCLIDSTPAAKTRKRAVASSTIGQKRLRWIPVLQERESCQAERFESNVRIYSGWIDLALSRPPRSYGEKLQRTQVSQKLNANDTPLLPGFLEAA